MITVAQKLFEKFDRLVLEFTSEELIKHFEHMTSNKPEPVDRYFKKNAALPCATDDSCEFCKKVVRLGRNVEKIREMLKTPRKK